MDSFPHRRGIEGWSCAGVRHEIAFHWTVLQEKMNAAVGRETIGSNIPRFRTSSRGQLRYTAKPSCVDAANTVASASKRASRMWTGLAEDIE